jgi:hypothetical protein
VIANNGSHTLTVLLGKGDGTFSAPISSASGQSATDLAVADFNKDGKLDAAVSNIGSNTFQVFLGNGDGTFQPALTFSTLNGPRSITAGDFNQDGSIDLAVAEQNNTVEIFDNVGGANFVPAKAITGFQSNFSDGLNRIRVGDFDKNGIVDLAVQAFDGVHVLWGLGGNNFRYQFLSAYKDTNDINTGDLNQDGVTDIMVSYDCAASGDPNSPQACAGIDVFYGQGNQNMFRRVAVMDPKNETPGQVWAADVNGDGRADLVALTNAVGFNDGLYVWLGHADGSFDQSGIPFVVTTDRDKAALVPGDWNRDGMIDFAQALPSAGNVEIYTNATLRSPCTTSAISPTVTVCQPVDFTYSNGSVHLQANAFSKNGVSAMHVYVDNQDIFSTTASSFTRDFSLPLGGHFAVTKAWDRSGLSFRSDRHVTVFNGTPGTTCSSPLNGAQICLPAAATASSPVRILANGDSNLVPTAVQLYVDGQLVINDTTAGDSYIDTTQNFAAGTHNLVFKLWDASGRAFTASKAITVQ